MVTKKGQPGSHFLLPPCSWHLWHWLWFLPWAKSACWPTLKKSPGFCVPGWVSSQRVCANAHKKEMGLSGCMYELVEHISLLAEMRERIHPWRLPFSQLYWLVQFKVFILRPPQFQYYYSIMHTAIPLVIKGSPQEPSWAEKPLWRPLQKPVITWSGQ